MSSKPKKQDYQASESEKASAAVAQAEYDYFKQKYDPLLQEMRDKVNKEDLRSGLRGRANADVMQSLSTPSYQEVSRSDASGDLSGAISGQLTKADEAANTVKNTMGSGVLGTARGQAADAQTGMAQASRLATSNLLERAKAKQQVAEARAGAAMQIGSAAVLSGLRNLSSAKPGDTRSTLSKMMTPTNNDGTLASSIGDRFRFSMGFTPSASTNQNFVSTRYPTPIERPPGPSYQPSLGQQTSIYNPRFRPGR